MLSNKLEYFQLILILLQQSNQCQIIINKIIENSKKQNTLVLDCIYNIIFFIVFQRELDYAGICFLVSGSTFAPLFYGFQCNPHYAVIYASIQGVFAIVLFSLCLFDFFYKEEWRTLKSNLFAGLGLTSAIPFIHFAIDDAKLEGFSFATQCPYYIAMAIAYLSGLYIYNIRFPEKHVPGKFDNCGQSHQIWHISVVIAILFTYVGSLNAYYQRLDLPCRE